MQARTLAAAAALLVIAFTAIPTSAQPAQQPRNRNRLCYSHISPTGNAIARCAASLDPYVPITEGSGVQGREIAEHIHTDVQRFCAEAVVTGGQLRHGEDVYRPARPGIAHWGHVPRLGRTEFDPDHQWAHTPRMVVVRNGRLQGVMFSADRNFPYLGTIPRPYQRPGGQKEVLHVWCSPDLEGAFTARGPRLSTETETGSTNLTAHQPHD